MSNFEPFLDAQDLSACVEATETAGQLNARARPQGAFWPLYLEESQPLGELFLSARVCPRSFRYSGLADNVLGLLWELPNGTLLRLGGRTVKNVAGFDYVRFLAGSGGRFGKPRRLVLRLRPAAEAEKVLRLEGNWPALKGLARSLRASSWAHALDAADLSADARGAALLLSFSGKPAQLALFGTAAQAWAEQAGAKLETLSELPAAQARPWARAQATLEGALDLAESWLAGQGGSLRVFLGQGLVQLQGPTDPRRAETALPELHRRLAAQGGHVEHASLQADSSAPQARWEKELLERLGALR